MNKKTLKRIIWNHYKTSGRHDLPWRNTHDPYKIFISEMMLQQTQVSRVLIKYDEFIKKFPTVKTLTHATVTDVLKTWQGLGYNRRALFLKKTAEKITTEYAGVFPKDSTLLKSLPGIGQSTSGAILAFAYNIPTVFIETNIRTIFIHHFFQDRNNISDAEIFPLIQKTLDTKNPRDWYYALMDYGVYLKQTLPNPSRKSVHHKKQSPFVGSHRELRAKTLRLVLQGKNTAHISKVTKTSTRKIQNVVKELEQEGFFNDTGKTLLQ